MTTLAQRIAMKNLPPPPPPPASGAEGIRVMYDEDLSTRLHFKEEIGFGNWGSVWLCMPFAETSHSRSPEPLNEVKVATKLVHRSKTATTKARVQSLWNEWKIVTSLGPSPHPSVVDFYSFVVSDSYTLITMAYHPRLVSVEVPEQYAKEWFRSLLSGVEYLHSHGIVHNDIKPANILLSHANIPVLVDFGFAKQYDLRAADAFHSNLSYGTPEYLSPERAAGHLHDSRKSDVWSLGVTFFEILVGRTPFEQVEGEDFSTKEQLHKYWSLTLRGKWVGKWSMSPAVENLLQRMVLPNADLRCTATAAIADPYWKQSDSPEAKAKTDARGHRKSGSSSSANPSVDPRRIFDGVPYRQPRHKEGSESSLSSSSKVDKENLPSDERRNKSKEKEKDKKARSRIPLAIHRDNDKENTRPPSGGSPEREKLRSAAVLNLSRLGVNRHGRSESQSQSKENFSPEKTHKQGGIQIPSLLGMSALSSMSPVKHVPSKMLRSAASMTFKGKDKAKDKENQVLRKSSSVHLKESSSSSLRRKPLGPRQPTPPASPAVKTPPRRAALGDRTRANQEDREDADTSNVSGEIKQDSVLNRMREWERERQRLREIERVEEQRREAESEEGHRRERECRDEVELRRSIEQQQMLEIELDRQREKEAEAERARAREAEMQREAELEREKERAREMQTVQQQGFAMMSSRMGSTSTPPDTLPPTPLSPLIEEPESQFFNSVSHSPNESTLDILKHSLKTSIDRTKHLYKTSTQALKLTSPGKGQSADYAHSRNTSFSSWEGDDQSEGRLSLGVTRDANQNEEVGSENQLDRMTLWLQNVEKVVEDARQNFAASISTPLPPLPVAPASKPLPKSPASSTNRSQRSRVPRRILPANQIFTNEYDTTQMDQTVFYSLDDSTINSHLKDSALAEHKSMVELTIPTIPDDDPSKVSLVQQEPLEVPSTPVRARTRRATIATRSPEANRKRPSLEVDTDGRKEKSKSQHELGRPITPVTRLEFELQKLSKPSPAPRLSALVEKSLLSRDPVVRRSCELFAAVRAEASRDELTASPLHVEPYPARPASKYATLDTPGRKHVEGVYDRFLMSTTGVKRVGLGYQSDNAGALQAPQASKLKAPAKRSPSFFISGRRPMPPPVSSEDLRRANLSPDEFGALVNASVPGSTNTNKEDGAHHHVSIVRRAIKAITVKR